MKEEFEKRQNIYIALEDLNFTWSQKEMRKVIEGWNKGLSLWTIGAQVHRDIDEIALLLVDLGETMRNFILARSNGIFSSSTIKQPFRFKKRLEVFLEEHKEGYEAFREFYKVEFIWDEKEVYMFDDYWMEGLSLDVISAKLKRNKVDCFLLLIDRLRKGFIFGRKGILNGFKNNRKKAI